ncbi:MAG: glycosyltransferase [Candidatus Saccharibacteria bacterium]|nr:glycosyltransferase [Candidatus Saccharibacteria bacterium]
MKVSVIVPVYNVEAYLCRCVDSILAQTYQNTEIILVDDGSPDNCPAICDQYATQDKRVKVIHKQNGGLSDARNAGIAAATGEWLAFVDGDDWVEQPFIATLVKTAVDSEADVAVCGYKLIYPGWSQAVTVGRHMVLDRETALVDLLTYQRYGGVMTWNKLYRARLFHDNAIQFPKGKIHEDNFTTYKTYMVAQRVAYCDEPLYGYVQREDSIMAEAYSKRRLHGLEAARQALSDMERSMPALVPAAECGIMIKLLQQLYAIHCSPNRRQFRALRRQLGRELAELRPHLRQNQFVRPKDRVRMWLAYVPPLHMLLDRCVGAIKRRGAFQQRTVQVIRRLLIAGVMMLITLRSWLIILVTVLQARLRRQSIVFVMMTPSHGNLGDQAIAFAQRRFLEEYVPEYQIIETRWVSRAVFRRDAALVRRLIRPGDVVCGHGGGNMGDQYPHEEEARRYVIQSFADYPVVNFPQTVFFRDTPEARAMLKETKRVYNAHPRLTLVAREKKSYGLMRRYFPQATVLLVPDIVLSLPPQNELSQSRSGAMTCLRRDEEKRQAVDDTAIIALLKEKYGTVRVTDTVVPDRITLSARSRQCKLRCKWAEFARAEVVVTDRLHGMVFAALTQTPCVVFTNYNHKVAGIYDWIRELPTIQLCHDIKELPLALETVISAQQQPLPTFETDWQKLARAIRSEYEQK